MTTLSEVRELEKDPSGGIRILPSDAFKKELEMVDNGALHSKFLEIIQEIVELNKSKGEDYESADVKFTHYYYNARDLWLQVNRKALRLKSLIGDPKKKKKPNHETVRQNAIDLAAFSLWLAAWIDLEEENGNKQ